MKGRRKRPLHRLAVIGCVLLGTLVLTFGCAGLYYNHLLNKINYVPHGQETTQSGVTAGSVATTRRTTRATSLGETTESSGPAEPTVDWAARYDASDVPVRSDPDIQNILLIGSDSSESDYHANADVIIILSINKKTDSIRMASILRDTGVIVPGRESEGVLKINSAYAYGGPRLLIDTIEQNFRVGIDNYIAVGFAGFDGIIDSLGGLDIELTAAEAEIMGLQPGFQHLNGNYTEWYCRIRKIDSDFQRTSRQRHVLELAMQKARGMSVLSYPGLLEQILPLVYTGLSKGEMSSFLLSAPALLNYGLSEASLPLAGSYTSYDYTFYLDLLPNVDMLQSFLYGS